MDFLNVHVHFPLNPKSGELKSAELGVENTTDGALVKVTITFNFTQLL